MKFIIHNSKLRKGQAMLVAILIIFVATIALALAAATVAMGQTQGTVNQKLANESYSLATAAIDDTLMRMTRSDFVAPSGPLSLCVSPHSCTIEVNPGVNPSSYIIVATAESGSPVLGIKKAVTKIQADVTINNGVTTVTGYQEIY